MINGFQFALVFLKPSQGVDWNLEDALLVTVVAQDPQTDLALLRINETPDGLAALSLLRNELPQVAQDIHVIGHPQGLVWSYTTGVVSQIRDNHEWFYSDGSVHRSRVLQIQTAINPGNSGGPVLDDQGRMAGLITFSEEGQNLNYAIVADVISTFISRARSATRRGVASADRGDADAQYATTVYEEARIVRARYSEVTAYVLLDSEDRHVGLIIEVPNSRTFVKAWQPGPTGAFLSWSLNREDGEVVAVGSSMGHVPSRFGAP